MILQNIIAILSGYLLGSIPCAYIAGRLVKGVDIRQVGGGNMGTLNTLREIGRVAGFSVLIADIAKGSLAVLLARWLGVSTLFVFIAGFAAIVGHNLPVFLKFRGGKGAATALGVLLALAPLEFVISFSIIVIVVLITSNFTLGLGAGFICMPLILWLFGEANELIFFSLVLALFQGLRYLRTARRTFSSTDGKKNLLIEKRYKPWQTKREK